MTTESRLGPLPTLREIAGEAHGQAQIDPSPFLFMVGDRFFVIHVGMEISPTMKFVVVEERVEEDGHQSQRWYPTALHPKVFEDNNLMREILPEATVAPVTDSQELKNLMLAFTS